MDITVSSRHTAVSPALRSATLEKIERLSRFLDMERAQVLFIEERNPRIAEKEMCEVTMEGHGHHVRAKVSATDQFAAVDLVVDKLEQQLTKLKRKLVTRNHARHGRSLKPVAADLAELPVVAPAEEAPAAEAAEAPAEVVEEAAGPTIVKTKQFSLKPMTNDEAVLQLELLSHNFFVFTSAETGRPAVLYRRSDGDYGLIETS